MVYRRMELAEMLRLRACSSSPAWTAALRSGLASALRVLSSTMMRAPRLGLLRGIPSAKKLRHGDASVLLPVPSPNLRKFLPQEEAEVRRLSQLRADELADHLGELALR